LDGGSVLGGTFAGGHDVVCQQLLAVHGGICHQLLTVHQKVGTGHIQTCAKQLPEPGILQFFPQVKVAVHPFCRFRFLDPAGVLPIRFLLVLFIRNLIDNVDPV
jgi:hypothetical protein